MADFLVKNLPPEIMERVLQEHIKQRGENTITNKSTISNSFSWSGTIEGGEFWLTVNEGKFDHFYERYPKKETTNKIETPYQYALINISKTSEPSLTFVRCIAHSSKSSTSEHSLKFGDISWFFGNAQVDRMMGKIKDRDTLTLEGTSEKLHSMHSFTIIEDPRKPSIASLTDRDISTHAIKVTEGTPKEQKTVERFDFGPRGVIIQDMPIDMLDSLREKFSTSPKLAVREKYKHSDPGFRDHFKLEITKEVWLFMPDYVNRVTLYPGDITWCQSIYRRECGYPQPGDTSKPLAQVQLEGGFIGSHLPLENFKVIEIAKSVNDWIFGADKGISFTEKIAPITGTMVVTGTIDTGKSETLKSLNEIYTTWGKEDKASEIEKMTECDIEVRVKKKTKIIN